MKYNVEVVWITTEKSYANIEVEAECVGDAKEIALDMAGSVDFSGDEIIDGEYYVESVDIVEN